MCTRNANTFTAELGNLSKGYLFTCMMYVCTANKGFVILKNIFFPRVATVDIVLWHDTKIAIASYGQYSAHGVATGTIEFATRDGKIAWMLSDKCHMQQKGIVPSQRSLSCELQYKLSVL